jgi:hypothetical protein
MCASNDKLANLVCRPIAAQFMEGNLIALLEFEMNNGKASLVSEKHYRLVPPEDVDQSDLDAYRIRLE